MSPPSPSLVYIGRTNGLLSHRPISNPNPLGSISSWAFKPYCDDGLLGISPTQGTLWYKNQICVPDVKDLRKLILSEAHNTAYSIHPGSTKMYYDLKERFWWHGMKRSVAEYVAICDTCQHVKDEH